jgi:hypothetical protein
MAELGFFLGASEQATAAARQASKEWYEHADGRAVFLGRGKQTRQPKAFACLSPESAGLG